MSRLNARQFREMRFAAGHPENPCSAHQIAVASAALSLALHARPASRSKKAESSKFQSIRDEIKHGKLTIG
jgi:hypothetical protein